MANKRYTNLRTHLPTKQNTNYKIFIVVYQEINVSVLTYLRGEKQFFSITVFLSVFLMNSLQFTFKYFLFLFIYLNRENGSPRL